MPKLSEVSAPKTMRLSDVQAQAQAPQQDMPEQSLLARAGNAIAQGYKDVNDFGNNLGDAFAHHTANLAIGPAQLLMHAANGVNNIATDAEPGNFIDRNTAAFDKWVQDRENAYQQNVPDSTGAYIGAGLGEVLPWATGLGEARALGLLPTASKTLGKLGTCGGEGAAMAAAQPVTNGGQDYAANKAKQVGIGAATGPLLYGASAGASALGRGVSNVAQHITNPQAIADANIARLYGADDATVQRLTNAPAFVPGEVPSAA